jgi:hypothetical protein
MWMTAVSQQHDLMTLTDPRRDGISIANLPIQTTRRLFNGSRNFRIQIADQTPHLVHIPRLEPGFFDVFCVLVREDPVEFFAASERVLDQVHVFADPEVDAFFSDVVAAGWVVLEDVAFEEGAEAGVSLAPLSAGIIVGGVILTDDFGLSTNPRTFSHALDLIPSDTN